MRIANGNVGMRITLTQEDYEVLTSSGKNMSVSVLYNGLGNPEDFLEISKNDLPGGHRLNITTAGRTSGNGGFPWLMTMSRSNFPKLAKLQLFGPEEVSYTPHTDHSLPGWYVSRPSMSRPHQEKKLKSKKGQPTQVRATVAPAKGLLDTMSLRQAIQVVNAHKEDMGEDLVLEITNGRLKALIELGS